MRETIVIFNNNSKLAEVMRPLLVKEGYRLLIAEEYKQLTQILQYGQAQLLLTDIVMEQEDIMEGFRRLQAIRSISKIPVIVVSDKEDEASKIFALNAGADDYCSTMCSPLEILARIRGQLRRYLALAKICDNIEHIYKVDELQIDDSTRTVTVGDKEVRLTPIEYKILRLLVMKRGKVLSIEEIYRAIWKMNPIGAENTIAVHIRHIREKIEENPKEPRYLKVVWERDIK